MNHTHANVTDPKARHALAVEMNHYKNVYRVIDGFDRVPYTDRAKAIPETHADCDRTSGGADLFGGGWGVSFTYSWGGQRCQPDEYFTYWLEAQTRADLYNAEVQANTGNHTLKPH